jgi:hypothetical protein
MTNRDVYIRFLTSIGNTDIQVAPTTKEVSMWLNRAQDKLIKTRYSGNNFKLEGFEQSQKRIEDLRILLSEYSAVPTVSNKGVAGEYVCSTVTVPSDMMIFISDKVLISPTGTAGDAVYDCWKKDANGNPIPQLAEATDATHDTLFAYLGNSLSTHKYRYGSGKPLRLFFGSQVELYTDYTYKPTSYTFTYIKYPTAIDIHSNTPTAQFCQFPESMQYELLQLSVTMYLAAHAAPQTKFEAQLESSIE